MIIAPKALPRIETIGIDGTIFVFTALAGLAATVIFGLGPALRASRPDLMQTLRAGGRLAGSRNSHRFRNLIVITAVALSFVLLIGSGLMVRSFLALQRMDPGFDPTGVLTFQLLGGRVNASPEQRAASTREIRERLRALPASAQCRLHPPHPIISPETSATQKVSS